MSRTPAAVARAAAVPGRARPQEGVDLRVRRRGGRLRSQSAARRVAEILDAVGGRMRVELRPVAVLGGVHDELTAVGHPRDRIA